MNIFDDDIARLNFEDIIWFIFIGLSVLDIVGDKYLKDYIKNGEKAKEVVANKIFLFILIISLFIYIYFFIRNYRAYEKVKDDEKGLYLIKLFGSALLVVGVIYLIYFQYNNSDFIGTVI